ASPGLHRPQYREALGRAWLQESRRGEDEGVRTRSADDLERGRQTVLGRAARKSERGPAERRDRIREVDQREAYVQIAGPGAAVERRCDDRECRRQNQVEAVERLFGSFPVLGAEPATALDLGVAHRQAALDLDANVLSVQVSVFREQLAVDVGHLAVEAGENPSIWERELDRPAAWEERGRRLDALANQRLGELGPRDAGL